MYATGRGVTVDLVRAYMWLDLAVTGGAEGAVETRDDIAGKMSPEQRAKAEYRVKEWLDRE